MSPAIVFASFERLMEENMGSPFRGWSSTLFSSGVASPKVLQTPRDAKNTSSFGLAHAKVLM